MSIIIKVVYIFGLTTPRETNPSAWVPCMTTTSDVFGSKIDVGATGRKREIVGGQAEEELRDAWLQKRRGQHQSVDIEKLYIWLTVPPITDNPSSKGIKGGVASRRAVPLQSSRVDEEALAVAARRASCANIDANRLPARVSGVSQRQVHAPTLLVS